MAMKSMEVKYKKRSLILIINSDYRYLIQLESINYYDDNDVEKTHVIIC